MYNRYGSSNSLIVKLSKPLNIQSMAIAKILHITNPMKIIMNTAINKRIAWKIILRFWFFFFILPPNFRCVTFLLAWHTNYSIKSTTFQLYVIKMLFDQREKSYISTFSLFTITYYLPKNDKRFEWRVKSEKVKTTTFCRRLSFFV